MNDLPSIQILFIINLILTLIISVSVGYNNKLGNTVAFVCGTVASVFVLPFVLFIKGWGENRKETQSFIIFSTLFILSFIVWFNFIDDKTAISAFRTMAFPIYSFINPESNYDSLVDSYKNNFIWVLLFTLLFQLGTILKEKTEKM